MMMSQRGIMTTVLRQISWDQRNVRQGKAAAKVEQSANGLFLWDLCEKLNEINALLPRNASFHESSGILRGVADYGSCHAKN
jgi:hypothetical protein